jgi:hypothetical protein
LNAFFLENWLAFKGWKQVLTKGSFLVVQFNAGQ